MQKLLSDGMIDAGDVVVVLTGSVVRGSGANSIKIHRVGTADLSDDPETRRRLRSLINVAPEERPRTALSAAPARIAADPPPEQHEDPRVPGQSRS